MNFIIKNDSIIFDSGGIEHKKWLDTFEYYLKNN